MLPLKDKLLCCALLGLSVTCKCAVIKAVYRQQPGNENDSRSAGVFNMGEMNPQFQLGKVTVYYSKDAPYYDGNACSPGYYFLSLLYF